MGWGGAKWDKRGAKWAGGRQICGLRGGANWGGGVVGGRRGGAPNGGGAKIPPPRSRPLVGGAPKCLAPQRTPFFKKPARHWDGEPQLKSLREMSLSCNRVGG